MTAQKTITEMVREMRERADQYEQQFSNGFGFDPFHAFSVRASIQKVRDSANNLEAALKLGSERDEGNDHPTVKPVALMRYLVRLVTRKGGSVLDPFMGSGTTGIAAIQEGMQFIGIERDAKYMEIARRRIEEAETEVEHESNNPKFIQQELPL